MARGSTALRGGLALLVALLVAVGGTACGGGDEEEAPMATVRPIAPPDASGAAATDQEVPDLELAAEEPEPSRSGPRNSPPRIRAMQVDPAPDIQAGSDVKVIADAEDPDGDPVELVYTWFLNDDEQDHEGPVFPTRGLTRGDTVRVQVVASDGRQESAPFESPLLTVSNGVPRIVSQPGGADEDGTFRYQVQVEDPEGDTNLRFSLAKAPRGMKVNAVTGLVEWTPGSADGTHPVEIVVEDSGGGKAVQTFELILEAPPAAMP